MTQTTTAPARIADLDALAKEIADAIENQIRANAFELPYDFVCRDDEATAHLDLDVTCRGISARGDVWLMTDGLWTESYDNYIDGYHESTSTELHFSCVSLSEHDFMLYGDIDDEDYDALRLAVDNEIDAREINVYRRK